MNLLLTLPLSNNMVEKKKTKETTDNATVAWTNKKRRISGIFKALTAAILQDVPDHMKAPVRARIQCFRDCQRALRQIPENAHRAGFAFGWVPWNMLEFPPGGCGREKRYDAGHIGGIIANYDEASSNAIRVAIWPIYEDGILVDVHFYVTNGWHSSRIMIEQEYGDNPADLHDMSRIVTLPVTFTVVESLAAVATSFSNQNKEGVRPMATRDAWRNLFMSGDSNAVKAVGIAEEYGFDASAPVGKRGKNVFWNGAIVDRCIRGAEYLLPFCDEIVVRRAMQFLANPQCAGLYDDSRSLKPAFFGGLCHVIAMFEQPGFVHETGLINMFSRFDFHKRISELHKKMSKVHIADTLNLRTKRDKMPLNRNENLRYLEYAGAMLELYRESVPMPNTKGGTWPECPAELRRLLWEAPEIDNPAERREFVAELQRTLPKRRAGRTKTPGKKKFTR